MKETTNIPCRNKLEASYAPKNKLLLRFHKNILSCSKKSAFGW